MCVLRSGRGVCSKKWVTFSFFSLSSEFFLWQSGLITPLSPRDNGFEYSLGVGVG